MKTYFRFIGLIFLIPVVIAITFYSQYMIDVFMNEHPSFQITFMLITGFISLLIFAPAFGFLFISHASLLPDKPADPVEDDFK